MCNCLNKGSCDSMSDYMYVSGFLPAHFEFMVDCVAQVTQTLQNRCFCKLTLRLTCTGKQQVACLSKPLVEDGI